MNNRLNNIDSTCSIGTPMRQQLADILEGYLADLERGVAQDHQAILEAHAELAGELLPYLENLKLLHDATREIRPPSVGAARSSMGAGFGESAAPDDKCIGEYRILREIGRGGMGIVYEAHQKSLNRQVALKILPFAAVLDQRQIARFRNEAQAAAQLHHPHIVPVYAVGQEQGVYYYAMQFIAGQSLEQAIGALRIAADARGERSTKADGAVNGATTKVQAEPAAVLSSHHSVRHCEFFRTVARLGQEAALALQHAHEFGIVHRDIKPSNLLIDNQGKLWVTDFGLARVQNDSGVTLTGDVVGTLRYMSPEQAAGKTALVDARTDIYSLGVTLYELLVQRAAHSGDDRQTLLRQVVNEEPAAPRRLNSALPADLETIVLAAMAKSREDRYPTAQALADDLERFLAGKPTQARRPKLSDRAAKWARRHKSLVSLAACALVIITAISAVGLVLLARAQSHTSAVLAKLELSEHTARENYERAERYFEQAKDAVDQFGMRLADRLLEIPGAEPLRREVLTSTLAYYRQFMTQAAGDPRLRHELAVAHFKSGMIAARLGARDDAIAEYRSAKELLARLIVENSAASQTRSELGLTHNNLALLLAAQGDTDAARDEYASAIHVQQQLVAERPADAEVASQLAESQGNFGMLLDQTDDHEGAARSLDTAVNVLRRLADSHADNPQISRNLAIALNNLSFVLRARDPQDAGAKAREAIAILKRLVKEDPNRIQFQDDLALCANNLAALAGQRQKFDEAVGSYQEAISLEEKLVRKAPAVVRYRSDLATTYNNLGVAYCRLGQTAEADTALAKARELLSTLVDDYPDDMGYRSSLAALVNNQALALAGARRHEEAAKLYPQAIQWQRTCWQQQPESATMREVLSKMYYNYGQSLRGLGRWSEAVDQALARREVWHGSGERLLSVAAELAEIGGLVRDASRSNDHEANLQRIDEAVVATLWQAHETGWPRGANLAADGRFDRYRDDQRFAALVAELGQQASTSGARRSLGKVDTTGTPD